MPQKKSNKKFDTPKDKSKAVGHLPSGLFIVCAEDKTTKIVDGYLASWIQQISFEPLLISIAVKPGRPAYNSIVNGNIFTINIVGDHDNSYIKDFWSGYDPQKNPFEKLSLTKGKHGGIIIENAKSVIEARLQSIYSPGDHDLIIAEVLESYVLNESTASTVHVRKTGMDY